MRQEVDGGYLWSPVAETNGVKSRLYDNMRRAAPGYSSSPTPKAALAESASWPTQSRLAPLLRRGRLRCSLNASRSR
jgi:hypothetical protein